MRIEKALVAACAMAAIGLGVMGAGAAVAQSANSQVVVINLPKVVQDSTAGQDMRAKLKALFESKQNEFRTQNQAAATAAQTGSRELQTLLQGKTEAQVMADANLKTRYEAQMRREQDLVQKRQIFEASMQQTEQRAAEGLISLLDPIVGQVMTQRGATIVLNAQGSVAKASPSVDITQDVTTRFNASTPRAPQPTWFPWTPPPQQAAPGATPPGAPKK